VEKRGVEERAPGTEQREQARAAVHETWRGQKYKRKTERKEKKAGSGWATGNNNSYASKYAN